MPSSASAVRIRHVPVVSWVKRPRETIVQSFPDCSSLFFIPIVIVETGQARRPDQLQLHSTYLLMFSPSLPFQLTIACVRVDSWKIQARTPSDLLFGNKLKRTCLWIPFDQSQIPRSSRRRTTGLTGSTWRRRWRTDSEHDVKQFYIVIRNTNSVR